MKFNIWTVLGLIMICYLLCGLILYQLPLGPPESLNELGDMFGTINGLFSALAFGGLIYSIWVQQKELQIQNETLKLQIEELKMQREDLELTRNEIKAATEQHTINANAASIQSKELAKQSKINLHVAKINSLKVKIEALEGALIRSGKDLIELSPNKVTEFRIKIRRSYQKIDSLTSLSIDQLMEEE